MICDIVRPDSVPAVQAYMTTDVCGNYRFSPGVTDCTSWDRQTYLYSLGEMLLSRVDFSDAGRNCCIDFSTRWMCFQAWITDSRLWMLVQTLPLPREELSSMVGFPGASPEGVAWLRGKVHRRRRVCRRGRLGLYNTVDGLPFCVRPVTGSHLFSPPLGRVLGLWQPHLPFGYLSGTILGDHRFSCVLFWCEMMSSCGGPSTSGRRDYGTAAGHIYWTRIGLTVGQTS